MLGDCFASLAMTFIVLALMSPIVFAEENAEPASVRYRTLATQYQQLRAADPQVNERDRWEQLEFSLERFIRKSPKSTYSGSALYHLGNLYETRFRARKAKVDLKAALSAYERLARDFSGHELADDALLSLGDLRSTELKDAVGARAAYFEIIDRYPKGDRIAEAHARVSGKRATESPKPQTAKSAPPKREVTKPAPSKQKMEPATAENDPSSRMAKTLARERSREFYSAKTPRARPLIVIDPGHGGDDFGAVGIDSVLEKDVVLNISLFLDELLRERLRAKTKLTRGRDVFISLADRTKMANDSEADLFVSIHANASPKRTLRGIETYYLDNTNDQGSLKLAERENQSLAFGAGDAPLPDLDFMLSDIIQSGKMEDSISLGHHLQDSLVRNVSRYYRNVRSLGVKRAPFYVLVGAHMPCVLVEVSFIDHPEEGRRLADRRYQKLLAEGLYRGIRSFFEKRES